MRAIRHSRYFAIATGIHATALLAFALAGPFGLASQTTTAVSEVPALQVIGESSSVIPLTESSPQDMPALAAPIPSPLERQPWETDMIPFADEVIAAACPVNAIPPAPEEPHPIDLSRQPASSYERAATPCVHAPSLRRVPRTATANTACKTGREPVIAPARLLEGSQPDYPSRARRANLQGTVTLRIEVLACGAAASVEIAMSSGIPDLDAAAAKAAALWRFSPATSDDAPIDSIVEVPVKFVLGE